MKNPIVIDQDKLNEWITYLKNAEIGYYESNSMRDEFRQFSLFINDSSPLSQVIEPIIEKSWINGAKTESDVCSDVILGNIKMDESFELIKQRKQKYIQETLKKLNNEI